MVKTKNEFERKFLLARIFQDMEVVRSLVSVEAITQIYLKDGSRFRTICDSTLALRHELIKKTKIEDGHYVEVMFEPDKIWEVEDAIKENLPHLHKIRRTYNYQGHSLEVDYYKNLRLITLEVEKESKEELDAFILPDLIKKYVITEITGQKEFSNHNLAKVNKQI